MGVYSEMAAELASRRADDRQQAEEEQAKALLSQM